MFCYTSFILVSLIASVVALPMENQWHTGMNQGGEFYSHFPPSNYGWTPFHSLSGGQQEATTYQQPHETNRGFAAPADTNNSQFSYFLHEPQLSHDGTHLTHSRSVSGAEHPSLYQQGQFLSPAEMYGGSQIQAPADFHEEYLPAANMYGKFPVADMHGVYPVADAHGGYGTGFFSPYSQMGQAQQQQEHIARNMQRGQSSRPPAQREKGKNRYTYVDSAEKLPKSFNDKNTNEMVAIGSFRKYLEDQGENFKDVRSPASFLRRAKRWASGCNVPSNFTTRGQLLRSLLGNIKLEKPILHGIVVKELTEYSHRDKLAKIIVRNKEVQSEAND